MFRRILNDSFSLVFGNLETVFKVCGAWFVLQFVLLLVLQVILGNPPDELAVRAGQPVQVSPAQMLAAFLVVIVAIVASASIAVAWHRFGLLGEQPGLIHLRVGAIEGRFILKMFLIGLITIAIFLPLELFVSLFGTMLDILIGVPVVTVVSFLVLSAFIIPHIVQLYLSLPAVAIERPIGLKEAHRLGQGLGWPMIGAGVVLVLPFVLVALGLQYLSQMVAGGGLLALLIAIKLALLNVLLQIILTVLSISVISAAYRIAMERQHANIGETPSNPD